MQPLFAHNENEPNNSIAQCVNLTLSCGDVIQHPPARPWGEGPGSSQRSVPSSASCVNNVLVAVSAPNVHSGPVRKHLAGAQATWLHQTRLDVDQRCCNIATVPLTLALFRQITDFENYATCLKLFA